MYAPLSFTGRYYRNGSVAHSERLRPFRVIIKASERICQSDMKFRVVMPRSAHARCTHHVTNIRVEIGCNFYFLGFSLPSPVSLPCTATTRFTQKSHEPRRKLSFSFSLSLSFRHFLPLSMHYRAAKDSKTLFAIHCVPRPKNDGHHVYYRVFMPPVSPPVIFRNLRNFPHLDPSSEKIALYREKGQEKFCFFSSHALKIIILKSNIESNLKSQNGIC